MSGLQFTPAHVRQIQRGDKTQTRRRVKGDQPARWEPGRSYAAQPGRGKPATCRIVVEDVRMEPLGAITFEDARAEGYRTRNEYKQAWVEINDKAWLSRMEDPVVVDRFDERWGDVPVWVITFELDRTQAPRYLAAQSDELYVTSPAHALADEPEAVSEEEQKRITAKAGTEFEQWQTLEAQTYDRERAVLSARDRITRASTKARALGRDVSRELWMVRTTIDGGRPPHMIEARLEALERKAYTVT